MREKVSGRRLVSLVTRASHRIGVPKSVEKSVVSPIRPIRAMWTLVRMISRSAFEPDEDYDRTHASNGVSRYGAYLVHYQHRFLDDDHLTLDAERFAAAAWLIAQPPVMTPGHVRAHPRVQATDVRWDDDQRVAVCVDLAVSAPAEAAGLAYPWRGWSRDRRGRWWAPEDYAGPSAVTLLRVAVPLTGTRLPEVCYRRGVPDVDTAKRAAYAVCVLLNRVLADVVTSDPVTADAS